MIFPRKPNEASTQAERKDQAQPKRPMRTQARRTIARQAYDQFITEGSDGNAFYRTQATQVNGGRQRKLTEAGNAKHAAREQAEREHAEEREARRNYYAEKTAEKSLTKVVDTLKESW